MHPTKVRNLIPSYAMEMEKSVDEVQTVMSFYYKTIRQKLSNLEAVNVHLENLGHFYIKEKALINYEEKCNKLISIMSNDTIREYSIKQEYQEKLKLIEKMKEFLLEERQRRSEVINKRFNNDIQEHTTDLEK